LIGKLEEFKEKAMKNNENVPKLRFPGFTDAWEQCRLGEMLEKVSIRVELEKELMYKQIGIRSHGKGIFYKESVTGESIGNKRVFWVEPDSLILNIVFAWEQAVARTTEKEVGMIASHRFPMYRLKRELLDLDFIVHFFLTLEGKQLLESASPGGAGRNKTLGQKEFESLRLILPSSDEQHKIGKFIDTLDDTISLHRRKLKHVRYEKKCLLQKMFPKNDEKFPEFRFLGFTDAWEQRTVSELADRYDNLRVPITASDRIAGSTPYYGANGIQDYVEGFTHDGEFILVAEDGASDLQNYPVQYVNGKVWVNNHAHVLQAKSEIADNKFLMNAMKNTNIEPYLVGGGRAKLNADVMMKISFRVPELAEQKQIGSFFSNLENLITLHQRKLQHLQDRKKALLQQMFV